MKIYITGLPSGYEVEHLVRLFYPMAPLTLTAPEDGEDCVWAEKKPDGLWAMVRERGKSKTARALLPDSETPEFALASLTYDLLRAWTGIRPPWGKMTGVRPVRLIHDKRAAGWSEEDIDQFFLGRFDCSRQKYQMAKAIADLQEPILKAGSVPKTYSLYIGIPFCPSRCSYCSFVSCNLDRDRKMVQPYVDCLCREVEEIKAQADKAGLTLCSIYIGGGTPTSLSADQLRQLMGTVRENFDLSKVMEYTVEAGRPDCTDAEKLAVIKEYGATRISINPQTFSDEVLAGIGRKHSAQDILDCYADARKAGHEDINMDLIAGLREEYCIDGRRTINTQDIRLCRRTLRDAATRGRSPAKTLAMWDRVMDGETRYIKGFKTTADFLLDTSFTYELGLIAKLLQKVRQQFTLEGHNAELWDETARRFEHVAPVALDLLPADSMLREFYAGEIGGKTAQ